PELVHHSGLQRVLSVRSERDRYLRSAQPALLHRGQDSLQRMTPRARPSLTLRRVLGLGLLTASCTQIAGLDEDYFRDSDTSAGASGDAAQSGNGSGATSSGGNRTAAGGAGSGNDSSGAGRASGGSSANGGRNNGGGVGNNGG